MQIDVLRIENNTAICNLYTAGRCVKIVMREDDYRSLVRDGFFTRNGMEADSAGVINTTHSFSIRAEEPERSFTDGLMH